MGTYRVELSKSGRAGCKGSPNCKENKIKIAKDELRFGVWVDSEKFGGSWHWRHWGCVTPFQMLNLKEACGGQMDMVDGYDEIEDAELQEKIERCIEQEHVDDEDWNGDEGHNRDGAKGYGPRKKKAKKDDVDDDGETETKKKRKADYVSEGAEEVAAPAKKSRKKKEVKTEDTGEAADAIEVKKPTSKGRKKAVKEEPEVEAEDEASEKKLKSRGGRKKVVKEEPEMEDEAAEAPVKKQPKPRGRKKTIKEESKPEADSEAENQEDDVEEEPEPPQKKSGRPKKTSGDVAPQRSKAKGKKA